MQFILCDCCISEIVRNVIKIDFCASKTASGGHFVKKGKSCLLISNGDKCNQNCFAGIHGVTNYVFNLSKMYCM